MIELLLSSVYMSYEAATPCDNIIAILVEHAQRKSCRLVLGCSANAHRTQCSSFDINIRDKSILNFIILNKLSVDTHV